MVIRAMIASARSWPVEVAIEDAKLAARFAGRGVVSYGLHSDERGFPATPFVPAFDIAREAGLPITPHAGELVGPESVREAVEVLHADRILHGVRVIEDPELVAEVARLGVTLAACPSSNVVLDVVPDLEHHPLPALLAAGVSCSINADDPIQFGPNVGEEYELAADPPRADRWAARGLRARLHHRLRRPGGREDASPRRHRRLARDLSLHGSGSIRRHAAPSARHYGVSESPPDP